jgi:hypothetical protein
MKLLLKKVFSYIKRLVIVLAIIVVVAPEWPAFQEERYQIESIVGPQTFDFLVWEANALGLKGEAFLTAGHTYLSDEKQKEIVLDYLSLLGEVRRQESQITSIYSDPSIIDPETAAGELQVEVTAKRKQLESWQPVAEAVLQEQVAAILAEQGFDLLDQTWPPVQMHMTPLPLVLVVSPREEIEQIHSLSLLPGLPLDNVEQIETTILERTDRSALVVPIGGVGIYPAMLLETSNINFLVNTIAHEWAHHWLTLHPMGLNYAATPGLRTMNETTASIVGDEIGPLVIERYYPEFIQLEAPAETAEPESDEPPPFNFRAEMAETRIRVDELLAYGQVEEAEAYMETRRQFFWDNGYLIRKINQAYFAFYGAYADTPGETGGNPIGPALVALRDNNDSLKSFLDQVAPITSVDELLALVDG